MRGRTRALLVAGIVIGSIAVGCAKAQQEGAKLTTSTTTTTAPPEDFVAEAGDFVRLQDMTPVREFFISNPAGHLKKALAVANSESGGTYPVGTIIQLVPQEAMVKRAPGFSPATKDWEFFELETSADGTKIHKRGGAEVVNRFGGSCSDCHALAKPQFDFICEDTNGCEPLPISDTVIAAIQKADPRPPTAEAG